MGSLTALLPGGVGSAASTAIGSVTGSSGAADAQFAEQVATLKADLDAISAALPETKDAVVAEVQALLDAKALNAGNSAEKMAAVGEQIDAKVQEAMSGVGEQIDGKLQEAMGGVGEQIDAKLQEAMGGVGEQIDAKLQEVMSSFSEQVMGEVDRKIAAARTAAAAPRTAAPAARTAAPAARTVVRGGGKVDAAINKLLAQTRNQMDAPLAASRRGMSRRRRASRKARRSTRRRRSAGRR